MRSLLCATLSLGTLCVFGSLGVPHAADLFQPDTVALATLAAKPALHGLQIEIAADVCPAFADCAVDARPDPRLARLLGHRFGFAEGPGVPALPTRGSLRTTLMDLFPSPAPPLPLRKPPPAARPPPACSPPTSRMRRT